MKTRYENVDLVVVRENTEDLYAGIEHVVVPGVVESLKIITEVASTRICRFAFEHAVKRGRKKVTAVHKANIMKLSDGLFLDCFRKVAREFPELAGRRHHRRQPLHAAGAVTRALRRAGDGEPLRRHRLGPLRRPGGRAGRGAGRQHRQGERAVFEAVHGTAPDIAGKGLANPTALLLSAVMMLDWLGLEEQARRIERAVWKVYSEGKVRTGDLGGKATGHDFTQALIDALA